MEVPLIQYLSSDLESPDASLSAQSDRLDDADVSERPITATTTQVLLFGTNCMSMERAHDIFWLALHQLWVLSWMSSASAFSNARPAPVTLAQWLTAVQRAELDMQAHRHRRQRGAILNGARRLCSDDLFHIAGGMNKWMLIEQRYHPEPSGLTQLAYVIKPSIAQDIHRFLDSSDMDFRFKPGLPEPDLSRGRDTECDLVFGGFPKALVQAHHRFVARVAHNAESSPGGGTCLRHRQRLGPHRLATAGPTDPQVRPNKRVRV